MIVVESNKKNEVTLFGRLPRFSYFFKDKSFSIISFST